VDLNPMGIYTAWLTIYSLSFTFLPMFVVKDWKKRGTADGFSSVNFVLPLLMMSCWFKYGSLTDDPVNKFINAFNIAFFTFYVSAFWWFQRKRKFLYCQLCALAVALFLIFGYVHTHPADQRADVMGTIAASCQIAGLLGQIYDIKRAISIGTTEYIPATIQFGIFALTIQWTAFAVLVGNFYMLVANIAGLVINCCTLGLYPVYPPKTWRVPLFGVGGEGGGSESGGGGGGVDDDDDDRKKQKMMQKQNQMQKHGDDDEAMEKPDLYKIWNIEKKKGV